MSQLSTKIVPIALIGGGLVLVYMGYKKWSA